MRLCNLLKENMICLCFSQQKLLSTLWMWDYQNWFSIFQIKQQNFPNQTTEFSSEFSLTWADCQFLHQKLNFVKQKPSYLKNPQLSFIVTHNLWVINYPRKSLKVLQKKLAVPLKSALDSFLLKASYTKKVFYWILRGKPQKSPSITFDQMHTVYIM